MDTGIYVRVSTEEQAKEGFSIRAQEEKLRSYADIKDWPLYNVYIDEGISGKNIEGRPALRRLMRDIEEGLVQNVLVFKVDRLTRSTKNLIELVEFFNANNCGFNSLTESIDTSSATGRMFLKIIGIFAEFERENLIERVKIGLERKAKEGYSLCAYTPSYGYSRPKGQKIQTIIEDEAAIVKEVFDMFLEQDFALNKIASVLNHRNVPTKFDALWNVKTVRLILENPNYIGKVRYQCKDATRYFEAAGLHDRIVDDRTFFRAQEKLSLYKKRSSVKRSDDSVYFARIAVCAKCGSSLTPKMNYGRIHKDGTRNIYRAYRCIHSIKGKCQFSCTHNALESAFENYIEKIFDFDIKFDLKSDQHNVELSNRKESERIGFTLEALNQKLTETMELYVAQRLSFDDYKKTLCIINDKKHLLTIQLNTLPEIPQATIIKQSYVILNVKENWLNLNNLEREEFLQRFVKKISVSGVKKGTHYQSINVDNVVFIDI